MDQKASGGLHIRRGAQAGHPGAGTEIARWTVNGKTYFVNLQVSRRGDPYIQVNALFGREGREKLTVFQPAILQFMAAMTRGVEAMTGLKIADHVSSVCGCMSTRQEALKARFFGHCEALGGPHWVIFCADCRQIVNVAHETTMEAWEAQ